MTQTQPTARAWIALLATVCIDCCASAQAQTPRGVGHTPAASSSPYAKVTTWAKPGIPVDEFARLQGIEPADVGEQWVHEEHVEGLAGIWFATFATGRLSVCSWSASSARGKTTERAFWEYLSSTRRIIATYTKALGKPCLFSESARYVHPSHHHGYTVLAARWRVPSASLQVAFHFMNGKGEDWYLVEIELQPPEYAFEGSIHELRGWPDPRGAQ